MSLDKWLKSEKPEKPIKKAIPKITSKSIQAEEVSKEEPKKLIKYILACKTAKCNYKKTIVKRMLTDKDKICPRCKGEMKVKMQ